MKIWFLWPYGANRRGPVGERVPQALDAGTVCVEGFADADDFQTGLIGQLSQKLGYLLRRFARDGFFPHVAIYCKKGKYMRLLRGHLQH